MIRDDVLRRRFARDGAVVVDLLDERDLARLRDLSERTRAHHIHAFTPSVWCGDPGYRAEVDAEVRRVVARHVEAAFDSMKIAFSGLAVKKPRSASEVPMHQDPTFVDEARFAPIGLWMPLVDTGLENGGLGVVPGSHVLNCCVRGFSHPFPYEPLLPHLSRTYLRHLLVRAGQALLFSPRLFHCSGPNLTPYERPVAYAMLVPAAATLRFLHYDWAAPGGAFDVYDVENDFYNRYVVGAPPPSGERIGRRNYDFEPLDVDRLDAVLGGTA